MEKKLHEQLKDLANEILAMNETSLVDLHQKTRALYELLTIQLHLEKNPPKNKEEETIEATDSKTYDKFIEDQDPQPVEQSTYEENLAEPLIEKIKDIVAQMPSETQKIDELLEELLPSKSKPLSELEDFASNYQQTPVFERKDSQKTPPKPVEPTAPEPKETPEQNKPKSLNDKLNKNIQIGLNDRLAFTKHLFEGNSDEYHRVISQITTMNNYQEATRFIDTMVKPDYNWEGKEQHLDRFLLLIEKKFN
ncbi:hypothetical protein [Planktosalinus lacus]|uniref:Uncharacterized protein n=1 Tax=Planktosalinus lacus TaxID=1526573 RepID=A0A8J2V6M3_9FLAO|nr:hypothetical protein [Planktosalinus lacus]GGD80646.1 hypothetical protein GCM10011312_01150 [Planktosalinus lacus]